VSMASKVGFEAGFGDIQKQVLKHVSTIFKSRFCNFQKWVLKTVLLVFYTYKPLSKVCFEISKSRF
jgi:hypothetical protein